MLGATLFIILFLAAAYGYQIYRDYCVPVSYTDRILGIPVVENLDFLEGKRRLAAGQNPGVCFEQTLLPYTSDGTLYLAQDFRKPDWVGKLTADSRDAYLCMLPDEAWADKAGSIRENHVFQLYYVEENAYYPLKLVISGMPVMTLTTEREEEQDKGDSEVDPDHYYLDPDILYYGKMQLFNPGVGVSRYEITESGMRYYERGVSSSVYPKKSYSLGLLDARGENLDVSLLGMRSDNSWKLKAMVADDSRVREKSACEIWESFAATNTEVNEEGPRMEYLELIVDNDYKGLYGIVEPVDSKKLNLDKNDVLYKSTDWMIPEDEDIQYAIDVRWKIMSFLRIRYPDPIHDYEKAWSPVRDYLNTFYRNGGAGNPADKVYLSNAVDVLLFNMAVSGSDNFFKNMYFAADVSETGTYKMRQIPWDLDMTFGFVWREGFVDDETVVYREAAVPYLIQTQPELMQPLIRARWQQCRETFLDTENIVSILLENENYLINAGVVQRENERWPKYQMSVDLEEIMDYQERRMLWLDEYFMEKIFDEEDAG